MTNHRYEILDLTKLLCCLLILLHHWSIYVYHQQSDNINLFITFLDHCRYVTAIFFSISGFLFYEKWFNSTPNELMNYRTQWLHVFFKIAPAYYFAILLSILVTIGVNLIAQQQILPMPSLKKIFYNLFMLQDFTHHGSISAGLWYVIIHLQNAAISLLIEKYFGKNPRIFVTIFFTLWLSSVFYFGNHGEYDHLFLYFFSSYGMGFLAAFALRKNKMVWVFVSSLTITALFIHFQPRLLLCFLYTSLMVAYFLRMKTVVLELNEHIQRLAQQVLYLFLFHYPILEAFNAIPLPKGEFKAYLVLILTIIFVLWVSNKFFMIFGQYNFPHTNPRHSRLNQ